MTPNAGDDSSAAAALRGRLFFGTSAWDYADWVGPFYRPETPRKEFLPRYAERLHTVEVDSTFDRMPTCRTVEAWVKRTPPGFLFSPKVPQTITHEKQLVGVADDVKQLVSALHAFGDRLGVVYVRLLGERLQPWSKLLARLLEEGGDVWVDASNRFAGHAPATITELVRRVQGVA